MSNVCCKEFTGWVKSFTKLERSLTVLEALLLVVLVALLILLILHLVVCSKPDYRVDDIQTTKDITYGTKNGDRSTSVISISETRHPRFHTTSINNNKTFVSVSVSSNEEATVKCSWTPSDKTTAAVYYYENGSIHDIHKVVTSTQHSRTLPATDHDITGIVHPEYTATDTSLEEIEQLIIDEQSDGEEAKQEYKAHMVALIKLQPPKDAIFGCILTIVSDYWTLTAASCIEAIEETDSLDSFVMMENYGNNMRESLVAVNDVQIHPLYEGKNKSYDLAMLRSGTSLTRANGAPVELASLLDYALLTLAQRFIILGYGPFRSSAGSGDGRRGAREARLHLVSGRQCPSSSSGAALRHLSGGRVAPQGSRAARPAPLCVGVLYSRALPCNYCAGAPLLLPVAGRSPLLLGVLADSEQCGVACEPALYVNVPDLADWIDAIARTDFNR